jgi:hypothetical protein
MLTSLDKWAEREPGLVTVRVRWKVGIESKIAPAIKEAYLERPLTEVCKHPMARTILATDDLTPEGVRELCDVLTWCPDCSSFVKREDGPLGRAFRKCAHWMDALPVTARLLLWRGQEVDWEEDGSACDHLRHSCSDVGCIGRRLLAPYGEPLTAVILCASDPIPVERVREAKRACAEAGVQFVLAQWEMADKDQYNYFGENWLGGHFLDGQSYNRLELP